MMNQKKSMMLLILLKINMVYELVQLYLKLNEAGKKKIMEELHDTAALEKYTEPVKRDAQKMA